MKRHLFALVLFLVLVAKAFSQNPTLADTNRLTRIINGRLGIDTNNSVVGQVPVRSAGGVIWGTPASTGGDIFSTSNNLYVVGATNRFPGFTYFGTNTAYALAAVAIRSAGAGHGLFVSTSSGLPTGTASIAVGGDPTMTINNGTNVHLSYAAGVGSLQGPAGGAMDLRPGPGGTLTMNSLRYPIADGTTNQSLVTFGNGTLGFITLASGGGGNVFTTSNNTYIVGSTNFFPGKTIMGTNVNMGSSTSNATLTIVGNATPNQYYDYGLGLQIIQNQAIGAYHLTNNVGMAIGNDLNTPGVGGSNFVINVWGTSAGGTLGNVQLIGPVVALSSMTFKASNPSTTYLQVSTVNAVLLGPEYPSVVIGKPDATSTTTLYGRTEFGTAGVTTGGGIRYRMLDTTNNQTQTTFLNYYNVGYPNTTASVMTNTLTGTSLTKGQYMGYKDGGNASLTNIVIMPTAGSTINGAASYTINNKGGGVEFMYDLARTDWNVIRTSPATSRMALSTNMPAIGVLQTNGNSRSYVSMNWLCTVVNSGSASLFLDQISGGFSNTVDRIALSQTVVALTTEHDLTVKGFIDPGATFIFTTNNTGGATLSPRIYNKVEFK